MDSGLTNTILAVVVKAEQAHKVTGGAPIFIVDTDQELEEIGMLIARTTLSMAHQIAQGIRIIVKH